MNHWLDPLRRLWINALIPRKDNTTRKFGVIIYHLWWLLPHDTFRSAAHAPHQSGDIPAQRPSLVLRLISNLRVVALFLKFSRIGGFWLRPPFGIENTLFFIHHISIFMKNRRFVAECDRIYIVPISWWGISSFHPLFSPMRGERGLPML